MRDKLPNDVVRIALLVLALNLLDAFLTLEHVGHGAVELNPLMLALLEQGAGAFVAGKHLMVAVGTVTLVRLWRLHLARTGVRLLVLPAYVATTIYQFTLFAAH